MRYKISAFRLFLVSTNVVLKVLGSCFENLQVTSAVTSFQVDLLINGERWSPSKPAQQLEVRVSSENFDSALAKMASACLPKNIFHGVTSKKSSDLGKWCELYA